jgi:hypothetical protein
MGLETATVFVNTSEIPARAIKCWRFVVTFDKIGETKSGRIAEDYVSFVAKTAIPRAMNSRETEEASSCDEELMTVRQCIETGNWDRPKCASYKSVRD